jgi:hypothetical protein
MKKRAHNPNPDRGLLCRFGTLIGFLLLLLAAFPARAELPDSVLARDYQNCIGNDNDPKRIAYCACVRDGMRSWSENDYLQMAVQLMTGTANPNGQSSSKLVDLTKKCIAQAFK